MECYCIKCGDEYNPKRKELGYDTCLKCGDIKAKEEYVLKSQRTVPVCNKGNYIYITDGMLKNDMKTLGRKV